MRVKARYQLGRFMICVIDCKGDAPGGFIEGALVNCQVINLLELLSQVWCRFDRKNLTRKTRHELLCKGAMIGANIEDSPAGREKSR